MYLDIMRNSPSRLVPDYSWQLAGLTVDQDAADHPVTVTLAPTDDDNDGQTRTLRARYVVGCDGARSSVREAIGRKLVGDSANQAWGVMDVLAVRSVAADLLGGDPDLIIGVNGSVARREATSGSDVDLFFLTVSGDFKAAKAAQTEYRERLVTRGIKMPANGGVFESPLRTTQLTAAIGGEDDTNTYITRRMLYLLEGEWVANEEGFNRLRSDLVARYVSEDLDEQKIVRFFLNDVIRYWRTICVDFENKTADSTKPRAIRLVKLRLSRMLLYAVR